MFEKEAEEYAKQNNPAEYGVRATHFTVLNSFKDGAVVGYNKANEWHFVKDGIFPTHSNGVLVFTDEGVGLGIYGLDNKEWYTYDTGFRVIAWKEIVLPELKESE